MPFQDRIAHAAAVAKWKADQQMRLFKSQSRISEIESQIRAEKASLADKTLALYAQEQLVEDTLMQICAGIAALHDQIKDQKSLQDGIRSERPPEQQVYSAVYPSAQTTDSQSEALSGLMCPQCGRALVGRFCPEHGVEGIQIAQEPKALQPTDPDSQIVCPQCGKVLSTRFCSEHGVEGIPQPSS